MELTTLSGEIFDAYIVGPQKATKAVLIIHDWWGVLDYNREWADELAKLGYQAMVIDLYEGYHPIEVKAAGEYMRSLDPQVVQHKLLTALTTLQAPHRKIAILGWSFGGLQAQHACVQNPDLVHALVIFYCRIILDKPKATILKCPILAIFSETERTWPDKQVALEQTMSEVNKPLECYSYDADHGFVNPDSPRYDSEVTEQAWLKMVSFLDKHLA